MPNVSMIDGHIDKPKMTYTDIIEALECCNETKASECSECPLLNVECSKYDLYKLALDLINRQKAEKEKLEYVLMGVMHSVDKWLDGDELKQDEVNRAITMREKTLQITEKQKAELERLYTEGLQINKTFMDFVNKQKSEAIKEVAERLKERATAFGDVTACVVHTLVDDLAKEMVGE